MESAVEEKLISVNELAKYFGVHPQTIYRRLWKKTIPAFKIGGRGFWKIAKKDIPLMKQ
jgi:excisionase family DNA binding protein